MLSEVVVEHEREGFFFLELSVEISTEVVDFGLHAAI